MSKTRDSKNRHLQYIAVILLVVFLLSAVLVFVSIWEKRHSDSVLGGEGPAPATITYNGEEYVLRNGVETVLFLGLDKFEGDVDSTADRNDKQSDFMMLLVIDNNYHRCTAIHINRDTMVDMNVLGLNGNKVGTVNKQIALAHTYGNGREVSCRNASDAVSGLLLNVNVDHYISAPMSAVPEFNDLVGGVEVEVLDDFTGIDDALVKGQVVTLTGEQALTYVRSRKGMEDSTNASRMVRQRQYIRALYEKTIEKAKGDDEFSVNVATTMKKYIVSNYTDTRLQELFNKISDYRFDEIRYLDGEMKAGERFMEFHVDEQSVTELVVELFYSLKD